MKLYYFKKMEVCFTSLIRTLPPLKEKSQNSRLNLDSDLNKILVGSQKLLIVLWKNPLWGTAGLQHFSKGEFYSSFFPTLSLCFRQKRKAEMSEKYKPYYWPSSQMQWKIQKNKNILLQANLWISFSVNTHFFIVKRGRRLRWIWNIT